MRHHQPDGARSAQAPWRWPGGLGFRWPIRSAGSVRIEAGYEHMFGDEGEDADFFKLSVGIALRF